MGQYYNSVLKDENGKIESYFNYGLKLMEHSYFNNDYVNEVCKKIYKKPHHVAWVGDYADEDSDMTFHRLHKNATQIECKDGFTTLGMVLVNHTKKVFLILQDYYRKNYANYVKQEKEEEWVIHPLPLLTCKGNGKGGGDYRGKNLGNVGIWAEDLLELVPINELEWKWDEKREVLTNHEDYLSVMFIFDESN